MKPTAMIDHNPQRLIPIRELSQLTGVNPVTIRAWERRYGLLKPQRTPKGHRLYAADDVALVQEIQRWLARGISISKVKELLQKGVVSLDADTALANAALDDQWQPLLQRAITAVAAFNQNQLDGIFNEISAIYPMGVIADRFIYPLLSHFSNVSRNNIGDSAERTFVSSYLRGRLHTRLYHAGKDQRGYKVAVVPATGEAHSVMAAAFAVALAIAGHRVWWLDAGVVLTDIPYLIERSNLDAAVWYADNYLSAAMLDNELPRLQSNGGGRVWFAGRFQQFHQQAMQDHRLHVLPLAIDAAVAALIEALRGSALITLEKSSNYDD